MSFSLKPNVCKRFLGLTKIFAISGLKSVYSPASAAYSQPPVPRQVATLKPPPAPSSVSSSYTIYPTSTSVQQTPAPISTYTPSSTFNSTVATSYSGTSAASKNILQWSWSNVFVPSGLSYSSYESSGYTSAPSYFQPAQMAPPQPQPQPPLQQPQQAPPPQQVQQQSKQLTNTSWSNTGGSSVNSYKKPAFHQNKIQKPKGPPKQPQLHYCDICKISCAGPQVSTWLKKCGIVVKFPRFVFSLFCVSLRRIENIWKDRSTRKRRWLRRAAVRWLTDLAESRRNCAANSATSRAPAPTLTPHT